MTQKQELQRLLQECSLHVHLILISQVLSRSGYGDVQILDRRHSRQKSRFGGCELLCQATMGLTPIKIIVKVINDSVRTRMLDELSGAIDRTGADFGILITPFDLTQNRKALQEVYKRSHIEVIDGARLIDMLHKYRIAVRPSGEPDYAFIEELEHRAEQVVEFFKHYARVR